MTEVHIQTPWRDNLARTADALIDIYSDSNRLFGKFINVVNVIASPWNLTPTLISNNVFRHSRYDTNGTPPNRREVKTWTLTEMFDCSREDEITGKVVYSGEILSREEVVERLKRSEAVPRGRKGTILADMIMGATHFYQTPWLPANILPFISNEIDTTRFKFDRVSTNQGKRYAPVVRGRDWYSE